MPDEEFIGKETDNKKRKKEEEEKRKGDDNDGGKNSGSGAKRGDNMRGGIYRSASKGENEDDAEFWDEHSFNVGREEGAEWEITKGTGMTTQRASRKRRRKKKGGRKPPLTTIKKKMMRRSRRTYPCTPHVPRG